VHSLEWRNPGYEGCCPESRLVVDAILVAKLEYRDDVGMAQPAKSEGFLARALAYGIIGEHAERKNLKGTLRSAKRANSAPPDSGQRLAGNVGQQELT
jgi:hypothetical protein